MGGYEQMWWYKDCNFSDFGGQSELDRSHRCQPSLRVMSSRLSDPSHRPSHERQARERRAGKAAI